jgi:hypothetical protein
MAVSAHRFMDDVFSYLNGPHPLDSWSFAAGSAFAGGPNFLQTGPGNPVPLWKDTLQTSTQLPGQPEIAGMAVASVTRDAAKSAFNFPTLAFNAIRDFSLDLLYVFGENLPDTPVDLGALLAPDVEDESEIIKELLQAANVSPAAWSSRYARVWAIANARKSVKIFNQAVVNRFFQGETGIINGVNNYFKLLAEKSGATYVPWDGLIWGYDTLTAIAKALARDVPVTIIASSARGSTGGGGYSDGVTCSGFTTRLVGVMETLIKTQVITLPPGVTVAQRVAALFEYRHMSTYKNKQYAAHSKCLIVDDVLYYCGSDNAYPNYNE